jgi:low temperature requirement protein LtrA
MVRISAGLRRWHTQATTGQVTVSELFFDLVFVFVVTQATHVVEEHPDPVGVARAFFPLIVVWWMFLAFGWLTNAVRPDNVPVRLFLTLAMMAFFITGLSLPFAFEPAGWAFPVAYLAVVAIHSVLFLTASTPTARRGILRVAPTNALAGLLVLLAQHLPEPWLWAPWILAVLVLYTTALLGGTRGFSVEPHHFVERHSLIILLVLGESIVAIGIGAAGDPVGPRLAAATALGIAVAAAIWWIYFNGDEELSVHALTKAPEDQRARMAYNAFALGHIVMVLGIILIAAGIADAIHHFSGPAHPGLLGPGAAVFLLGHAGHRAALRTGRTGYRVLAAVAVVPAGLLAGYAGWAGLIATIAVLAVVGTIDHFVTRPAEPTPGTSDTTQ